MDRERDAGPVGSSARGSGAHAPPTARRRRLPMRGLVIAVVVLIGLLVAVDFGAAALAESAVSRQMREQVGLVEDPAVRINGFPFLTQALAGQYSSIDVDATRITVGQLREVELTAHLEDVTAPLPMLLGSGPKSVQVQRAQGSARVGPNDLERLVPGVRRVRIETVDADLLATAVAAGAEPSLAEIDPDRAVRVVGTVPLLDRQVEVAMIAVLEVGEGGEGRVGARDVRLADGTPLPIPAADQRELLERFTVPVDAGTLPLRVTPATFRARDGALEITGTATGLTLGAAAAP